MSPTEAAAVAKQADQLKQEGNTYFKKDRFGAAIDAYTEVNLVLMQLILEACIDMKFDGFVSGDCFVPSCSRILDQSSAMPSQEEVRVLDFNLFV